MSKALEHDDPFQLQAMGVPDGDLLVQARVIVEEFMRMGLPMEEVERLFSDPFYAGTRHLAEKIGPEKVSEIIVGTYGRRADAIAASRRTSGRDGVHGEGV